jgi:DNA damage-binding protein 1
LSVRGDFIIVGDLMKSVTVLQYGSNSISEIARDYIPAWTTAIEAIDDDNFISAETGYNIYSLRKQSDATSEEEKSRLEITGQYRMSILLL